VLIVRVFYEVKASGMSFLKPLMMLLRPVSVSTGISLETLSKSSMFSGTRGPLRVAAKRAKGL
jgi:hypothetical protein